MKEEEQICFHDLTAEFNKFVLCVWQKKEANLNSNQWVHKPSYTSSKEDFSCL